MTTETMSARSTDVGRVARITASVVCALLVSVSVWVLASLSMNQPRYELNELLVIAGVTALIGFLGLIALGARWGYYLAVLIVTAIPGILALGFALFATLVVWTGVEHTFESSWRPISFAFAFTAPFFLPPIVAGVLLLLQRRATWLKVLVVIVGIGALYALCVYRGFFG